MGTNYYRIPTEEELKHKKGISIERVENMDMSDVGIPVNQWKFLKNPECEHIQSSPLCEFISQTSIHIGKRSMGWMFCWNFHNNKFYSNKDELLNFIRNGRIIDEYGQEIEVEEFIKMALEWGQPNGWIVNEKYYKENYDDLGKSRPMYEFNYDHYDILIDGLRVSSSTEFC